MKQLRSGDRLFRGKSVRLIDQDNQQLGIVSFETAIAKAQQAGLDLVLVPSRTEPPVTRIMDFGKYQFDEAKRAREAKRAQMQPKLKEIKIHATIDDNDFQIKCRHAIDFLTHGDKVRLLLVYRGRELSYPELGMEVLNRFIAQLETVATQDGAPKRMGKSVTTVFTVKPQFRVAKPSKPEKGGKGGRDEEQNSAEDEVQESSSEE